MSKGDFEDVQRFYDAAASWLRDSCRKGDKLGIAHAESRLKELDAVMAPLEAQQ